MRETGDPYESYENRGEVATQIEYVKKNEVTSMKSENIQETFSKKRQKPFLFRVCTKKIMELKIRRR